MYLYGSISLVLLNKKMIKENGQNITIKKEQMRPRLLPGQHNFHLKPVQTRTSTSRQTISNVELIPMSVQNVNNNIAYTSEMSNNGNVSSIELHQANNHASLNLSNLKYTSKSMDQLLNESMRNQMSSGLALQINIYICIYIYIYYYIIIYEILYMYMQ